MEKLVFVIVLTLFFIINGAASRKISVSLKHEENFAPDHTDEIGRNLKPELFRVKREIKEWGQSSSWNKPSWDDDWEDGEIVAEADDADDKPTKTWFQVI